VARSTSNPENSTPQSRLCFVIMPFSATQSCTEKRWTSIFENLIRPAVENAGLNYVCRRSTARRGNIVAAIIEALRDAYVVIADLTDQNPNVFYELGVRHTLTNRTVLLAQDQKFIPFDLRPYAYHVYDWRTAKGKQQFATKLRELLIDVDKSPDRADNPVSDFLKGQPRPQPLPEAPDAASQGTRLGEALAGPAGQGVDPLALGQEIASTRDPLRLRDMVRLTRMFFAEEWPSRIEELGREPINASRIPDNEIWQHCLPYIERFAPDMESVEAFGLPLVEAENTAALVEMLRIPQDWISMSDKIWPSPSLRAITGTPGLLALRMLATWGAKAADCTLLPVLATLLTHPLETIEAGGQAATLPLVDRRDMFHPDALLDHADLAVRYLQEEPWKNPGVARMFASRQDYLSGLSQFLFLATLLHEARHPNDNWPLYPGFKLVEGHSRSIHTLVGRISTQAQLMDSLARMANEDVETFRSNWPKRARRLNDTELGGRYFTNSRPIPEKL
jgi:hypothetical protein